MHVYDFVIRVATSDENEYGVEISPGEIKEQIENEVESEMYGVEVQDVKWTEVKE